MPRISRLAACALVAGLAACGTTSTTHTPSPPPRSSGSSPASSASGSSTHWDMYTSTTLSGFSFSYPSSWTKKAVEVPLTASVNQEEVTLTAPDGTLLRFDTNLEGLGGACPVTAAEPAVTVKSVTSIPAAPGLGVATVLGKNGAVVGYGVVPTTTGRYGPSLTLGVQQQCGVYLTFLNPATGDAVVFGILTPTSTSTPVPAADQATEREILGSLTVAS